MHPGEVSFEVRKLRFRADDPARKEAASILRELADEVIRANEVFTDRADEIRTRADELEAGIVTVPDEWDPGRLRKGWSATASIQCDLDGDDASELVVGICKPFSRQNGWSTDPFYLVCYRRENERWLLAWKDVSDSNGYLHSKGVIKIEHRDFDGDGRRELLAHVSRCDMGNGGGGGGSTTVHVYSPSDGVADMREILRYSSEGWSESWGGGGHYHKFRARVSFRDVDEDGHDDVVVKHVFENWGNIRSKSIKESRVMLREERHLWRGDRYVLDAVSMVDDYCRHLERARLLSVNEGFALLDQVRFDYLHAKVGTKVSRTAATGPCFRDWAFTRANILLKAGRADEAFELLPERLARMKSVASCGQTRWRPKHLLGTVATRRNRDSYLGACHS